MSLRSPFLSAAAVAALLVCAEIPADACAPAYPPNAVVTVAEESAIIVYDAVTRTQHFIRRASFHASVPDFGFLVPTPTVPELAEAPDSLFSELEDVIRPPVIHRTEPGLAPGLSCLFFLGRSKSAPEAAIAAAVSPPVRVLASQQVAGYDAVVLEADSAGALAEWLGRNGYATRPELAEWLTPYITQRWKITAFKIAKGAGTTAPPDPSGGPDHALSTSAVRMSFRTDSPFFPYREPSDQRAPRTRVSAGERPAGAPDPGDKARARMLRVFFVSNARMDGAIGAGQAASPWPGRPVWANEAPAAAQIVERALPAQKPGQEPPPAAARAAWLTVFEDASSPRPGTDELYFSPSPSQAPLLPEPVVIVTRQDIPIPLDLVALAAGVVWAIVRTIRRARRRAHAPTSPPPPAG